MSRVTSEEGTKMEAVLLTGREAKIATLRHKLGIATSRAQYAKSKAQRESEATAAVRYAEALRVLEGQS